MDSWKIHLFSQAKQRMKRLIGDVEAVYANLYVSLTDDGIRRYHMTNLGLEDHDVMLEEEVARDDLRLEGKMFHLSLLGNYQNTFVYDIDESMFEKPDKITVQSIHGVYEHTYMDEPVEEGERLKTVVWAWLEECIKQKVAAERTGLIKEELIAATWHPDRVERWLTAGVAIDDMRLIDMMLI